MTIASADIAPSAEPLPTHLREGPFAIRTDALTKRYGAETVLHGVSLEVPEGAVYVLVGPNGAGKSTTFKILMDLLRPESGSATVLGLDPRTQGTRVRGLVGYVPERFEWGYPWMRVRDLLDYHASYFASWDADYAAKLVRLFDLRLDRKFGSLSKGQTRRVHLTMALAHRPRLLLLDEPTDGLDPVMLDDTLGLLVEHIAASPTTLVISTHQVHDVDRLADHVGVMRGGRIILQAPRDVLRRNLLEYRFEAPEPWLSSPDFGDAVLRRESLGREMRWRIWGDEADVVERLARTGAAVRDASALTLADAALTLLRRGGAR